MYTPGMGNTLCHIYSYSLTNYENSLVFFSVRNGPGLLVTRHPVRGVFCECSAAKVTENPRVAARYDAECIISVHREACYWSRSEQ